MPNRKLEKRFEDIDLDDLGPAPTDDDSDYHSELYARGVKPEDLVPRAAAEFTKWLNENGKNPDTRAKT